MAEGDEAKAAEDASIADLNGDGWLDVIVACELAHVIYFQNPGRDVRGGGWPRVIPDNLRDRGSFIRAFFADLDGDGRPEVTVANKGEQLPSIRPGDEIGTRHPNKEISWFRPPTDPLSPTGWKEHVLTRTEVPINARPVDLDGDGDLDILGGSRWNAHIFWFENRGGRPPEFQEHLIEVIGRNVPWQRGAKRLTGMNVAFHDFSGDGRLDIVIQETPTTVVWLEQPDSVAEPWPIHSVGSIAPDASTGLVVADINSDGRADIFTGTYSQQPRDHDGEHITAESRVGRLAWFEHPGDPAKQWTRHDISRRKRGMYDGFIARDMDGDSDIDFIGTRGNSGNFDGVFWLEQIRTRRPRKAFTPARQHESAPLPLPAAQREKPAVPDPRSTRTGRAVPTETSADQP